MRQLEAKYGIKLGPENTQFADFSALCEDIGEHVVATAWTLQHPAVASAIVGVHNVEGVWEIEPSFSSYQVQAVNLLKSPNISKFRRISENLIVELNASGTEKGISKHPLEQLDGFEEAARLHLNPEATQYLDETFSINRSHKLRPGAAPESYSW